MTREETKDFLHILNVNFPNSFKHIKTNKDMQGVEDMWHLGFKNQSLESMSQALIEYLSTEVNVATPSLGQLFSDMKKMVVKNIDLPQLNVDESWNKVLSLAKCDYAQSKKNYHTLPINVQKALGSPQALVDIANSNPNRNDYLRNDFIKKLQNILSEEVKSYQAGRTNIKSIAYDNGTIDGTIEGLPGWYLETEQTPPDKQLLLEIEQIKENLRNGN